MGSINTMLTLDGESGFRRAINNINAQLKTFGAELTKISTELDSTENKQQKFAATQEKLKTILDTLKEKEKVLVNAVQASNQAYKDNASALEKLKNQHDAEKRAISEQKNIIQSLTAIYGANSTQVKDAKKYLDQLTESEKATSEKLKTTEKAVQGSYNAYHRYKTQLAETRTQIQKTEQQTRSYQEEQKKSNKEFENAHHPVGKLGAAFDQFKVVVGATKAALEKFAPAVKAVGSALSTVAEVSAKTVQVSVQAMSKEFELATQGFETYAGTFFKAAEKIGKFSYDTGASFESSMSQVQAYSQASAEDMEKLAKEAQLMGSTTSKTASEAADALGYLALNGYKTDDMLASLKPVVKAAEAGHMDLARAADLTSSSIKAYGLTAKDTNDFLNVMTATQNNSATSLEDLLGAYTNSAAMFKTLNVPMAESATILGTLANRGFKGTEVGNNLNSILVNLIGANEKAATAMTELGVSAWTDEGTFRGLNVVLSELGEKLSEGTDEERAMIEAAIGGKRQFKTLEAMISGVAEEYDDLYEATSNAVANDVLNKTAETMLDNVKGSVTLMKSAFEGLGISIFDTFSKDLNLVIKNVANFANMLQYGLENNDLITSITNIGTRVRGMIRETILKMAKELPSLMKAYNKALTESIKTILYTVRQLIPEVLPEFLSEFKNLLVEIANMLPEMATTLADAAIVFFNGIVDALNTVLPIIGENLPAVFDAGIAILNTLIEGIYSNFPILVETALGFIVGLVDAFAENIDEILEVGFFILMTVVNGIIENLPHLLEVAMQIITSLVGFIQEHLSELVEAALQIILALSNFLLENLPVLIAMIPDLIRAIVQALADNADLLAEAAVVLINALFYGLVEAIAAAVDIVDEIFEAIAGVFGAGEWGDIGKNIMNGIFEGIKNVAAKAGDLLKDTFTDLKDAFCDFFDINSPSRLMKKDVGINIGAGVIEGINDAVELDPQALQGLEMDIQKATNHIAIDNNVTGLGSGEAIQVGFYGPIYLNNLTSDIDGFIEAVDDRVRLNRMATGRA